MINESEIRRTRNTSSTHTNPYVCTDCNLTSGQMRLGKENHWKKAAKERDRGSIMKKMTHKRRYFMFTKLYG